MPHILDMLDQAHKSATAMYDQTNKSMRHLETLSAALHGLADKADIVTTDDVVKAGGKLVGSGNFSAQEMATILTEMPATGGQGLASWIAEKLEKVDATLAKLGPIHAVAKHEMGVSAMRALQAHMAGTQPVQPGTGTGGNPLSGGSGAMTLNEETPMQGEA